jgi:hypothetical protein
MEEAVDVTLVVDIEGLKEWALSLCQRADAGASVWKGAALMARTLTEQWSGYDVSFSRWDKDIVVETSLWTGDRDLTGDEECLLSDVNSRTNGAVYAAIESGLWVIAASPCFGIYQSYQGLEVLHRTLYDTEPTKEQAEARLAEIQERHRDAGLTPERYQWSIEPMPVIGERRRP